MAVKPSFHLRVLGAAVGQLLDGKQPFAAEVAALAGCEEDAAATALLHFESSGDIELAWAHPGIVQVVRASRSALATCGIWSGQQLVDAFIDTLSGASESQFTPGDAERIESLTSAASDLHPGLLEGILATFLFRLDLVDPEALRKLRAAECG